MAKGAGMIAPNMATMLAFFTTDAAVEPDAAAAGRCATAVGESLNRITVDGDTSTNDCAVVLASGASGAAPIDGHGADYDAFARRSTEAARQLAEMLVRDGEGVDADRRGARRGRAHAGRRRPHRPHRGRVPARQDGAPRRRPQLGPHARGRRPRRSRRSTSSASTSASATSRSPRAAPRATTTRRLAAAAMHEDPVRFRIRLDEGAAAAWIWTCDLSHGYVDINAHYRS